MEHRQSNRHMRNHPFHTTHIAETPLLSVATPAAPIWTPYPPTMPTVEDYFDDDTDLPLPSSSSRPRNLPNTGHRGALLEEIAETTDDMDMDYSRLSEQSRGIFGENASAPPPSSSAGSGVGKGKMTMREGPGELRPTTGGPGGGGGGGQPQMNPNSPMGGFMGDLMRLQQAEDERMEKLRKQFGNASVAADPEVYKGSVRPLFCHDSIH